MFALRARALRYRLAREEKKKYKNKKKKERSVSVEFQQMRAARARRKIGQDRPHTVRKRRLLSARAKRVRRRWHAFENLEVCRFRVFTYDSLRFRNR